VKKEEKLKSLCRLYIDISTKYQESIIAKKSSEEISELKLHLNNLENKIQSLMIETDQEG
jgi:signal transduction histidine kinase